MVYEKMTIQLTLINKNPSQPSLIVVDRNRLVTLKFVYTAIIFNLSSVWWSENKGACPITEPNIFAHNFNKFSSNKSQASIFQVLMKRQDVFNGIGASHASEILHLALEHPAQKASVIFDSKRERKP